MMWLVSQLVMWLLIVWVTKRLAQVWAYHVNQCINPIRSTYCAYHPLTDPRPYPCAWHHPHPLCPPHTLYAPTSKPPDPQLSCDQDRGSKCSLAGTHQAAQAPSFQRGLRKPPVREAHCIWLHGVTGEVLAEEVRIPKVEQLAGRVSVLCTLADAPHSMQLGLGRNCSSGEVI
eukprot:1182374-Prorocentrum_minimum.AAC.1